MQNIRSHNGIPRRPALARAATQRYIGSQKTRSKDGVALRSLRDTIVAARFFRSEVIFLYGRILIFRRIPAGASKYLIFSKTSDQNSSFFKSVFLL